MRILFLTTYLPGRCQSGSEIASQAIVDSLHELGHHVDVIGFIRAGHAYTPNPQHELSAGKHVMETQQAAKHQIARWMLRSWLNGIPYSCAKHVTRQYRDTALKRLSRGSYDVILIDHVQMGWIIEALPSQLPRILVAHNVETDIYEQLAGYIKKPLIHSAYQREKKSMAKWEQSIIQKVSQVWALTESDRQSFCQFADTRQISIFSRITVPAVYEPEFDVGLLGMWTWQPNGAALKWFVENVTPHLSATTRIEVAGKGAEWLANHHDMIHYRGFVDNAQTFLQQARVVAIPSVAGSGIQIKTLDAIALGLPVVVSPLGARGITDPPATMSIAQTPEDFAKQLQKRIQCPPDTNQRQQAARWSEQRRQELKTQLKNHLSDLNGC